MKNIIKMSPDEYAALPRNTKRELKRNAAKQGLKTDDVSDIKQRTNVKASVDSEFLKVGLGILDANGMTMDEFIDLAFQNLIAADEE